MRWAWAWAWFVCWLVAASGCKSRADTREAQEATSTPEPTASAPSAPPVRAHYVGRAVCVGCHAEQGRKWTGSHHDLAMQLPTSSSVLGDFRQRTLRVGKEAFTFRRDGDAYVVDVARREGKASYPVRYVFGVQPLQQVLVDVGKGHLQALSVAWDARPTSSGGQRWFSLQPGEDVPPGDPLHWRGPQFNWNFMCASCHSTSVDKRYDEKAESYGTRYAEVDVACEACHGKGSAHADAARARHPSTDVAGFHSLEAEGRRWERASGAPIAHLVSPSSRRHALETCAPCHSRRSDLGGEGSYHDRYRLALLDENLYFADGQIKDEVYVYGSFAQSRMFAAGVDCSDCHDPHSLKLREQGNSLCSKCHDPAVFDSSKHHFHAAGSDAALCVSCHMPQRTYMVLDPRRDHRFGVPQPLLSEAVGSPDVCTECHHGKDAKWAAAEIGKRLPQRERPSFATALHQARNRLPGAIASLGAVVSNPAFPAIVRATALSELSAYPSPALSIAVAGAVKDPDPLVRRAAVVAASRLPPREGSGPMLDLLGDPMRSVRIEAASMLIGAEQPPPPLEQQLRRATREYEKARTFESDRAGGLSDLAHLRLANGDAAGAEQLFRRALRLDPTFSQGYVNLADLYRAKGRERDAERLLEQGLSSAADAPLIHHALGLSRVRSGRKREALGDLEKAHRGRPDVTRYAFVYAVALHDAGRAARALDVLREAQERAPADPELLSTLASYCAEAGLHDQAQRYAALLDAVRRDATPPAR